MAKMILRCSFILTLLVFLCLLSVNGLDAESSVEVTGHGKLVRAESNWNRKGIELGPGDKSCGTPILSGTTTTKDFPVDVVYTWVEQPSERKFNEIKKDCPELKGGWQRLRDLNTLQFSYNLLEKNLPWVRKVFIVTPGEVPQWLNTSNPKIEMIKQENIWMQQRLHQDQPIHNSQSVEAHLHRIPGLSTHFIYLNDDMFVGRPLDRSFFFTDAGEPIIHADLVGKVVHHTRGLGWCHHKTPGSLPLMESTHTYSALTIPLIEHAQAQWPLMFDKISATHCRGVLPANNGPTWVYGWHGFHTGLIKVQKKANVSFLSRLTKNKDAWYRKQLRNPPDVGCINDDFNTTDETEFAKERNALSAFMIEFSKAKAY